MTKDIGREFMSRTRLSHLMPSPQSMGIPMPRPELTYPDIARRIDLPKPADVKVLALDLRTAIENRATLRRYSDQPLSIEELTFLLWVTQGIKSVTSKEITFRTVPSAGARHAFETYLLINRVMDLSPGLYRYLALEHALIELDLSPQISANLSRACMNQTKVQFAAATFFWVAVVERMSWRYVERGYRYLHLDAGHICQNLYLAAEAIECGVCGIAAFDDDDLNAVLGLDGEELFVIYAASLGKK